MLLLGEPGRALVDRFRGGDLEAGEVDRHPVLSRWARVAQLGLRPDSAAHPEGSSGVDLASRKGRLEAVFREESPLLAPMADELSARSMLAIVADPEGVIVLARGGGGLAREAGRVRLVEGTRWSEGARGTNAIGTAIAERRPVAVVGAAHYEERNHGLFCYAMPIHDPYGNLVAVLDVSGAVAQHSPAVGIAVQAAGTALERALRLGEYAAAAPGGYAVVERMLQRSAAPALLVEASGAVLTMNSAARLALGLAEGNGRAAFNPITGATTALPSPHSNARSLTVERVFGISAEALRAMALSPREHQARFETAGGRYRIELEPILGAGGRLLSLVVYLDREVSSLPQPSPPPPVPQRTAAPLPAAFDTILGTDPELVAAKRMAARFAPTPLPLLLLAETGTGKELFARAAHSASRRRAGPFIALNCGALSASLLESELFGHAPGAFTGAQRGGSQGKLAAADGGTLFLDEIAEMPEALQATLLRVLEDGSYYRVGEARPRKADFRLICATCRDLATLVSAGRFRRDLFFRIQGACVIIPPLRDRADRLVLARALLAQLARESSMPCPELAGDAVAWILEHDWPGNVRELKSALAHALIMSDGAAVIDRAGFPRILLRETRPLQDSAPRRRDEILNEAMTTALRECDGNVAEAARRLGVARSTLYRRLPPRPKSS